MLKLQVTSEEDPFFLHTMEVSEEDFQSLKQEQAILVDFGAFPAVVPSLQPPSPQQVTVPPSRGLSRFE